MDISFTHTEPTASFQFITPELATEMLYCNGRNRPPSLTEVRKHVKRLKNGTFGISSSAISFDSNGQLTNGQHRLMAVVEAGIGAYFLVAFGMPPDSFKVEDSGKGRTAGDHLSVEGKNNAVLRASIAKEIMRLRGITKPDAQEVAAYEGTLNQDLLLASIHFADRAKKKGSIHFPQASGAAYYLVITKTEHPSKIDDFFLPLADGIGLEQLRAEFLAWVRNPKLLAHLDSYTRTDYRVYKMIETWNSWLQHRKLFPKGIVSKMPDIV